MLKPKDQEFIVDLLKFHRNSEEKLKDMESITTGKPTEFNYSRCFFIVKNNGKKDDFSVQKCIERLEIENKKKNK